MNKYSYYTPVELAEEIVKLLPKRKYNSVIDICCGTWNLLFAAYKRFPHADYFGVDVDESIKDYIFEGATFTLDDGRKFSAKEKSAGRTYDLILSNPPFGNLDKESIFWDKSSNDTEFSALKCQRYEAEMMLANIYLAHSDSILVFILPITFVKGDSFREARKQIAKSFTILEIIELPINTFKCNKLKTVAVIMKKAIRSSVKTNYRIATLNEDTWHFGQVGKISRKEINYGNWVGGTRANTNINIRRGKIHSGEMGEGDIIVLHCSSAFEGGKWKPSIRRTKKTSDIRAEYGDILINRIGKGAGYWCINELHNVEVSDCLFIIKNNQKELVKKLYDNSINGKLNISTRGVSTTYITKADICSIINEPMKK